MRVARSWYWGRKSGKFPMGRGHPSGTGDFTESGLAPGFCASLWGQNSFLPSPKTAENLVIFDSLGEPKDIRTRAPAVKGKAMGSHMVDGIYYEFIWFPSNSCVSCLAVRVPNGKW